MIALELACKKAAPMPCTIRNAISTIAAAGPLKNTAESPMDAAVKIAKPRLYMRTRPNMSPIRPKLTTSTAETSR